MDIAELGFAIESDGVVKATDRLGKLDKQAKKTEKAAARLKKQVREFNRVMKLMAKVVALAGVAIALLSIRAFAKFDKAMTNSLAIMGNVSVAMKKKMSDAARKLALTVTFSAAEIAEGFFFLASAGLNAKQSIAALPQVAKFAQAGMFDMALATDLATDAQSALGLTSRNAEKNLVNLTRVTDVLVGANTLANASVQQFSEALTNKAGAAMRQLNIEIESGVATLAAWADQGVKGAEAGERFNIVTRDLQTAFRKQREEFDKLNISVFEGGQFRNMSDIVRDLENALSSMTPEMQNTTLATLGFQDRSVIAIKSLLGFSAAIARNEEKLRGMKGITEEVANNQLKSFSAQMDLLGNEVNDAAISLGEQLAPAILILRDELKNSDGEMAGLTEAAEKLVIVFGRLAQALLIIAFVTKEVGTRLGEIFAILDQMRELTIDPKDFVRFGGIFAIVKDLSALPEKARKAFDAVKLIISEGNKDSVEARSSMLGFIESISKAIDALGELNKKTADAGDGIDFLDLSKISGKISEAELQRRLDLLVAVTVHSKEFALALDQLEAQLDGPAAQALQLYNESLADINEKLAKGEIGQDQWTRALAIYRKELKATIDENDDFLIAINDILEATEAAAKTIKEALIEQVILLEQALEETTDPVRIARLQNAISQLKEEMADLPTKAQEFGDNLFRAAGAAGVALRGIQSMTEEGSKSFARLEVAIQIANVAAAIGAVLNQGHGDPFTAFARMAAMTAAVAALGVSIGNISGGFTDTAGERQASQGTGSVLGDATAKSESILNAVEITAKASRTLVGLNRGMLRALQVLESGISGAANIAARGGVGDIDFEHGDIGTGAFGNILNFLFDPLGLLGNLFGGRSKITDEGIAIFAGTISEIINQGLIVGFQEVQFKKWIFGSTRTNEAFADLGDDAADQFALILTSIADTVREGALALGLSAEEIDAAIAAFTIEEQRISLMGLSAEEQQAALEAVFSQIFDDLAAAVVPFIGQFQQVGEGLGETLIRVATQVLVVEEAIKRLGFQADQIDPEQFAQLSDALIQAAGGLDAFISGMNSFIANFASESVQFDIAQRAVTEAFDAVGLAIPDTRDAMFDLMQTLDANTEEGRAQIAMLLELADTADAYYSLIEARENERASLQRRIFVLEGDTAALRELELEALDASNRALLERIFLLEDEAEAAAILARHEEDVTDFLRNLDDEFFALVASAEQVEFRDINRAFEEMTARAIELGLSERILLQIRELHQERLIQFAAELEESLISLTEELFGVGDVIERIGSNAAQATQDLSGMADAIRNTIIAIQGTQGLSTLNPVGQRDFLQEQFDKAIASGDFAQANQLAGRLAASIRTVGASGTEADAMIEALLEDLRAAEASARAFVPPDHQQVASIDRHAERIDINVARQVQIATAILDQIGLLALVTGENPLEIAERLGIPFRDLLSVLLDVEGFTVDTIRALGTIATNLGVGLEELAEIIGVNLGTLDDSSSLLNEALRNGLADLPDEISAPLLRALEIAERSGDVSLLESLVDDLPVDFRNHLAPFFDSIDFTDPLAAQLAVSESIRDWTEAGARSLRAIELLTGATVFGPAAPEGFADGTPFVKNDGLAYLHRGEAVIPADQNESSGNSGTVAAIGSLQKDQAMRLDRIEVQMKKRNDLLERQERREKVKI